MSLPECLSKGDAPPGATNLGACYSSPMPGDIHLITNRIDPALLERLVRESFGDMVKYVADLERRVIAVGGELHADAEAVLLESGSSSRDLWGANYFPGRGPEECIEYTALINIRPAQGNMGMEVRDSGIRERMRLLTSALIGEGESLA
jgi:hypothetical protein